MKTVCMRPFYWDYHLFNHLFIGVQIASKYCFPCVKINRIHIVRKLNPGPPTLPTFNYIWDNKIKGTKKKNVTRNSVGIWMVTIFSENTFCNKNKNYRNCLSHSSYINSVPGNPLNNLYILQVSCSTMRTWAWRTCTSSTHSGCVTS